MNIEELGNKIIGAAIRVHRVLGPGLLESAYQKCLDFELRKMGPIASLFFRYNMKRFGLMPVTVLTCLLKI